MLPGASICAPVSVQFQLSSFFKLLQLFDLQIIHQVYLSIRMNWVVKKCQNAFVIVCFFNLPPNFWLFLFTTM